nr:YciI family protein [Caenimonas sedimenti]
MKFLCLGYYNRRAVEALGPDQLAAVMKQCEPHMAVIAGSAAVRMHVGLAAERTKQILRTGNAVKVMDGPFSEAKEVVGAVLMIEAETIEAAIEVAVLHPTTQVPAGEQLGWRMEVRPVHFLDGVSLPT